MLRGGALKRRTTVAVFFLEVNVNSKRTMLRFLLTDGVCDEMIFLNAIFFNGGDANKVQKKRSASRVGRAIGTNSCEVPLESGF